MYYLPFDCVMGMWIINEFLKFTQVFSSVKTTNDFEALGVIFVLETSDKNAYFLVLSTGVQRKTFNKRTFNALTGWLAF